MRQAPAHVIISGVFLILIGIVFGYSYYFFPDTHPIDCWMKMHTGKDCPSCGFSRSFSHFTHFQFSEGKLYNSHALPVFLFFVLQFILRSFVITHYLVKKKSLSAVYVKSDALISISTFLLAFLPLLNY